MGNLDNPVWCPGNSPLNLTWFDAASEFLPNSNMQKYIIKINLYPTKRLFPTLDAGFSDVFCKSL
jgi:hypothetical protein